MGKQPTAAHRGLKEGGEAIREMGEREVRGPGREISGMSNLFCPPTPVLKPTGMHTANKAAKLTKLGIAEHKSGIF